MKQIKRDQIFEKHFKQRISPNEELVRQIIDSLELFAADELSHLNDHALSRKLAGKRAFSVTDDIRVVYVELNDTVVFLDIGSHDQVYK